MPINRPTPEVTSTINLLLELGFQEFPCHGQGERNFTFQLRKKNPYVMLPEGADGCASNDGRLQLVATVYNPGEMDSRMKDLASTVSLDVTGDTGGDNWFKLSSYCTRCKDFTQNMFVDHGTKLVKAWSTIVSES